MEFNFNKIIDILKKRNIIYTSEAELQFDLMQIIKEEYPTASVRCEFEPDIELDIEPEIGTLTNKKGVIRIDIVVFYDGLVYPIEVKFRKTKLNKKCYENGLEIVYHDQDAPDEAAFYYINDIYRIQQFCDKYSDRCKRGYTVFLTNQEKYTKCGYNKRKAWKDINIFKTEDKVKISSSGEGKISGVNRKYVLNQDYEAEWEKFEIQDNEFYLFWNEIEHSNNK